LQEDGMSKLIEAIYSNGVLKPSEKLNLHEGEKVEIQIRKKPKKIVSLRGIWKDIQISQEDIEKAKHIWEKGIQKWNSM